MLEVQGKYNQAKIFTDVVDQASIAQVIELCSQEFTSGSRIRLMPDVHAGAGCTVGTTMTITDKVVPNLVGWISAAAWRRPGFGRTIWSCRSWIS